jgi:hypothetical protein
MISNRGDHDHPCSDGNHDGYDSKQGYAFLVIGESSSMMFAVIPEALGPWSTLCWPYSDGD